MTGPQYSEYEFDIIRREYPRGGTASVQRLISRSQDSIRRVAKRLGVKYELHNAGNQLDCADLIHPTTYQSAYILGMLWADGTVHQSKRHNIVSLTLKASDFQDINHLFPAWKFMVVEYKKHPSWSILHRVSLSHKTLVAFLISQDYGIKSLVSPTKILSVIPRDLHRYFYRGWFDGDGYNNCLIKDNHHCCIAGAYNQDWSALETLCRAIGTPYYVQHNKNKRGRGANFTLQTVAGNIKFCHYIYSGYEIGLKRKFKNWVEHKRRYLNSFVKHQLSPPNVYLRGVNKNKYVVNFTQNGESIYIGTFWVLEEAIEVRDSYIWKTFQDATRLVYPEKVIPNYFRTLGLPSDMLP